MRRIVLTYGLIAGAMLSVMFAVTMGFKSRSGDFDNGMLVGYASMVAAFLMVYFGIRAYRDQVGAGGSVSAEPSG